MLFTASHSPVWYSNGANYCVLTWYFNFNPISFIFLHSYGYGFDAKNPRLTLENMYFENLLDSIAATAFETKILSWFNSPP